jgi:hypothetical protein
MLLPNGLPLYEHLDTAFTKLPELLRTLREARFHGYVELQFPKHQYVLLCDSGDLVSALEEGDGQRRAGQDVLAAAMARAGDRGGEIRVVELTPELVFLCASQTLSQPVHAGLSTEFTQLDRLLADLGRQRHTGHVEVLFTSGATVLVFFDQGEEVDVVCTGLPEPKPEDGTPLLRVLRYAQKVGGTINVFRSAGTPLSRMTPDLPAEPATPVPPPESSQHLLTALQELLGEIEAAVEAVAGAGAFDRGFRRAQQECSQAYPFLDPFEGLFEFREGRMSFEGTEPPEVLIPAVRDCLGRTLAALARDPAAGKKLRARLLPLAPHFKALPAEFGAWGFDPLSLLMGEAAAGSKAGRTAGGDGNG